jgi:hypothetical protein
MRLRWDRIRFWFWRRFRSVDVKAFGAYGDRIHDDTAAIQAAIDYAGKRWWRRGSRLKRGTYVITRPLRFSGRPRLFGDRETP